MDIVLGVSMAPAQVRMVLVEGENADGVTVDQDVFQVTGEGSGNGVTVAAAPDQVTAAILGARESARAGGYHLTSTGVTFSDQAQAAVLRDALVKRKVENVMLVSAFLAAAALAQAVGNATGYVRTGLLFIEPDTAAFVVVDSADGSITRVRRCPLSSDRDTAVTELAALVAGADALASHPDGLFVVGSGVDVAMIKPALEATTSLSVSVPEQPELALAQGAALASAHAPLFASSTRALAWAQDPGTDEAGPGLITDGSDCVPVDYDATDCDRALAYSALPDTTDSVYLPASQERKPFLLAATALITLFILGVATLVVSVVVSIRPATDVRPDPGQNIVVPTQQATVPPPAVTQPAPPPPSAVPPAPSAPPVQTIPKRAPATYQPPVEVPAPPPVAPAAPAPVIAVPVPVAPQPLFPGLRPPGAPNLDPPQQAPQQRWFPRGGQTRGGFHPFHPFHPFQPERGGNRGLFPGLGGGHR